MSNEEVMNQFRTFGSALRPGLVLAGFLAVGVYVGRQYDSPVEGLATGLVGASIVNGILAWNDARSAVA